MSLSSSPPPAARPRLLGRKRNLRLSAELEQCVDAAAAAAGLASAEWTRRAIVAALPDAGAAGAGGGSSQAAEGNEIVDAGTWVRRIGLRVPVAEAARWEAEAAEHGLNLTRYVRLQMSVTPDQARRVATAVETLGGASVHIARIGRNLNQIARSINTMPGQTTAIQRRELSETCKAVDLFSDQITEVCGALNMTLGRRRARRIVGVADGETA